MPVPPKRKTDRKRYCRGCERETTVWVSWGNDGKFEYCPECSFPYDFFEPNE